MKKTVEATKDLNNEQKTDGAGVPNPGDENKPADDNNENEKKGFWKSLGIGAKIAIGGVGAAVLAGGVLLIKALFSKDDDEDEAESESTETTDE